MQLFFILTSANLGITVSSIVNIVVSCTNRKTRTVPRELTMRSIKTGSIEHRAEVWIDRLQKHRHRIEPAFQLYSGDHWSVARSLPDEARKNGIDLKLWVCSAGYGLIEAETAIAPYSATFASGFADSIARNTPFPNAERSRRWWNLLSNWTGPSNGKVRTIATLARLNSRSPLLIVGSETYIRAMEVDLNAAAQFLEEQSLLLIVSASSSMPDLKHAIIPCDSRFQPMLGGARQSLNIRAARKIISDFKHDEIRSDLVSREFASILSRQNELVVYNRRSMTDVEITRFIKSALKKSSEWSHSRLLRNLRDSGCACEQSRFAKLFKNFKGCKS